MRRHSVWAADLPRLANRVKPRLCLVAIVRRSKLCGYPRVYFVRMKVVKVRRVGNSNVVSIPRELEARGYAPGTSVLVEELDSGELRIMPTEQVRERIRGIGRRVVAEHSEALRILAEHDPDSESTKT